MGLITRLKQAYNSFRGTEARSNLRNPDRFIKNALGVNPTKSGVAVTQDSAMTLSAVYNAVRVLADAIAVLPVNVFQKTSGGATKLADHPVANLLRNPGNSTASVWKETMMAQTLLWGNGISFIVRSNGGELLRLKLIESSRIAIMEDKDAGLVYKVDNDVEFSQEEILHIPALGFNGLTGKSVISFARENLGLGIAAQDFGAAFFGNGAHLGGVLEHPATISNEALEHLKSSWRTKYSGANNTGNVAILEEGMKFNKIGIPPEDAQFIETRKFSVTDVARWFKLPPHLIADLERSTFSNIVQQDLNFVKYSVQPWVKKWEEELERKLLTAEDRAGGVYIKFNLDSLLRADPQTRFEVYVKAISYGILSRNEVREMEERNAYGGGDEFLFITNLVQDKEKEMLTAKSNGHAKIN